MCMTITPHDACYLIIFNYIQCVSQSLGFHQANQTIFIRFVIIFLFSEFCFCFSCRILLLQWSALCVYVCSFHFSYRIQSGLEKWFSLWTNTQTSIFIFKHLSFTANERVYFLIFITIDVWWKNKRRTWHSTFHIQFHVVVACKKEKKQQKTITRIQREWENESAFVCRLILSRAYARSFSLSVCVCIYVFLECRPSFKLDSFNFYVIYHLVYFLTSFLTFQFPFRPLSNGAAASFVCVIFFFKC